jgi:hypothetical protein
VRTPLGSITFGDDHEAPLYVDTSPEPFTATQKLGEGHDTEAKLPLGSINCGTDHVIVVAIDRSLLFRVLPA